MAASLPFSYHPNVRPEGRIFTGNIGTTTSRKGDPITFANVALSSILADEAARRAGNRQKAAFNEGIAGRYNPAELTAEDLANLGRPRGVTTGLGNLFRSGEEVSDDFAVHANTKLAALIRQKPELASLIREGFPGSAVGADRRLRPWAFGETPYDQQLEARATGSLRGMGRVLPGEIGPEDQTVPFEELRSRQALAHEAEEGQILGDDQIPITDEPYVGEPYAEHPDDWAAREAAEGPTTAGGPPSPLAPANRLAFRINSTEDLNEFGSVKGGNVRPGEDYRREDKNRATTGVGPWNEDPTNTHYTVAAVPSEVWQSAQDGLQGEGRLTPEEIRTHLLGPEGLAPHAQLFRLPGSDPALRKYVTASDGQGFTAVLPNGKVIVHELEEGGTGDDAFTPERLLQAIAGQETKLKTMKPGTVQWLGGEKLEQAAKAAGLPYNENGGYDHHNIGVDIETGRRVFPVGIPSGTPVPEAGGVLVREGSPYRYDDEEIHGDISSVLEDQYGLTLLPRSLDSLGRDGLRYGPPQGAKGVQPGKDYLRSTLAEIEGLSFPERNGLGGHKKGLPTIAGPGVVDDALRHAIGRMDRELSVPGTTPERRAELLAARERAQLSMSPENQNPVVAGQRVAAELTRQVAAGEAVRKMALQKQASLGDPEALAALEAADPISAEAARRLAEAQQGRGTLPATIENVLERPDTPEGRPAPRPPAVGPFRPTGPDGWTSRVVQPGGPIVRADEEGVLRAALDPLAGRVAPQGDIAYASKGMPAPRGSGGALLDEAARRRTPEPPPATRAASELEAFRRALNPTEEEIRKAALEYRLERGPSDVVRYQLPQGPEPTSLDFLSQPGMPGVVERGYRAGGTGRAPWDGQVDNYRDAAARILDAGLDALKIADADQPPRGRRLPSGPLPRVETPEGLSADDGRAAWRQVLGEGRRRQREFFVEQPLPEAEEALAREAASRGLG